MNILYITVDALRADHVTHDVMPKTRRFVNEALEYTRCYANGPGTPWSFPALLGSRYSGGASGFGIPGEDDPRPTLAEVLRDEGFATAGFTDNRFASSDYNYDRGMEFMLDAGATAPEKRLKQKVRRRLNQDSWLYQGLLRSYHLIDDLLVNLRRKDTRFIRAEVLVEQALDWIENRTDQWFAWLHPMDTHAPYEAPDEYQLKYLDDPISRQDTQKLASKATHHPDEMSRDEWKLQKRLYKAECRYLDDQLGYLVNSLPESVKADTVIVITSDHGEMHGEHDLGGHPQQFWEPVIHVPCAISIPNLDISKVDDQASLIDLPPTILDAVETDIPKNWDGHSILPTDHREIPDREFVFVDVGPELHRDHAGVRHTDDWKLLRHGDDGELLLDLNTNPEENPTLDRSEEATGRYRELTEALDAHLDEMERRRGQVVGIEDTELIEDHLKELGYLE